MEAPFDTPAGDMLIPAAKWHAMEEENARLTRELSELRLEARIDRTTVKTLEVALQLADQAPTVDEATFEADVAERVKGLTRELKDYQGRHEIKILAEAYARAPTTRQLIEEKRAWPSGIKAYVNRLEHELRAVQEIAQPGWAVHFPVAAIPAVVQLRKEGARVREALLALQIKCGQCICGEGTTDECCPQCIPSVPTDIFQRYAAAVKLIEKVRQVGISSAFVSVFQVSALHHAGYDGENWKDELAEFDRACGREPAPPRTVSEASVQSGTGAARTGA